MATVRWQVTSSGGVGAHAYSFRISDGKEERTVTEGASPAWDWKPSVPGTYRVKAVVRDSLGNAADSGWSPEYEVGFALGKKDWVAVMPVENLAGAPAPLEEVRETIIGLMKAKGLRVLGQSSLEQFMARHRIRYTGGLTRELGEAFREETGTKAVLFVSLALYDESFPPKIAFQSRLVSTGERTAVLWMDSVEMAGSDNPGILGIGLIRNPRVLRENALKRIVQSLVEYLSGGESRKEIPEALGWEGDRFHPKESYRSERLLPGKIGRPIVIAVLPFRNESTRRNAGEIMALHFVKSLSELQDIEVIEPGVIRQELLTSRTIMDMGLSLAQADLLRVMLEADLVVTGNVLNYQDAKSLWGSPRVDFLARVIDVRRRQAVWESFSYNRGDDGVFFFGLGKRNTAHSMASAMARAVVGKILRGESPPGGLSAGGASNFGEDLDSP